MSETISETLVNTEQNPKILLGVGDLLGCGYYRCAVPYRALSKEGFEIELTNYLQWEEGKSTNVTDADVLVLQRQHRAEVLAIATKVKERGGKVVFELDDYFHDIPKNNPAGSSYLKGSEQVRNIEAFLRIADLVTVSTPGLQDCYSKYNSNIHVCPNQFESGSLEELKATPYDGGEFRLGWAGSSTHYDDFITIAKPISELMIENPNITFVFIGHDYRNLLHPNVRNRCVSMGHTFPIENGKALFYSPDNINPVVKYYDLLKKAKLHAAIAPILQVTFNRCKSYVKLMEYGLAGVPWVATNFGPYSLYAQKGREWDRNRPIGMLADRNPEWKRAIKTLLSDEKTRQNIVSNNLDFLRNNCIIEANINLWKKAYESIGISPGKQAGKFVENLVKSE